MLWDIPREFGIIPPPSMLVGWSEKHTRHQRFDIAQAALPE
jgi:hypothetical protein